MSYLFLPTKKQDIQQNDTFDSQKLSSGSLTEMDMIHMQSTFKRLSFVICHIHTSFNTCRMAPFGQMDLVPLAGFPTSRADSGLTLSQLKSLQRPPQVLRPGGPPRRAPTHCLQTTVAPASHYINEKSRAPD